MRYVTNQDGDLERLLQTRYLALDIETVSVKNKLPLGIGVAVSPTEGYYFFNPKDPVLMEAVAGATKVALHNCKFDIPLLRDLGYVINDFDDTKMLAYSRGYPDTSLETLTQEVLFRPYRAVTEQWKDKNQGNLGIDHKVMGEICLSHALHTFALWEGLKPVELYEKIDRPCVELLMEMEQWGLLVDQYRLTQLEQDVFTRAMELKRELIAEIGDINLGSSIQVAKALYDLGIVGTKKTKANKDSVSDESLRPLDNPIANKILAWRREMKTLSTYVPAFRSVDVKGRMHTSFGLTSTGRWSSSGPNLQNMTRDDRFKGITLRGCIAAEEGYIFIAMDASQLELRVVAILSQDPKMLEIIEASDLHMAAAVQIFGHTDDKDEMKRRRYDAKQLNFAILYGADSRKVSEMAGCSKEKAEELINQYFATYPVLKRWIDNVQRHAKASGFVTNMFGRIRHIPEITSASFKLRAKGEREAVNSVVQGTAVDIVKLMMLYLKDSLDPQVRMVLQVHDEILLEVPEGMVESTLEKVGELAQAFPDYPCTVKVGKYYGNMEEL